MKKSSIIFIALAFIAISCQKEISPENPTNTNPTNTTPTPGTNLLMKRFIALDTTLSAPNDTIIRYTFNYDNLKRCISVRGTDGVDSFVINNNYNGSDTLITKRKISDFSLGDSIVQFFTYSPQGKILSDSVIEYAASTTTFIHDYRNTTNQNGRINAKSNGVQFEYNNFSTLRDNNSNLLNVKDSLYVLFGSNYLLTQTVNSNYTYDTKINPFYKTVPGFLADVLLEGLTAFSFFPFQSLPQKNNALSETKVFNPFATGLENVNNTCQYTYNAQDYPTVVRIRDILNNKYYKGIYIY